MSGVPAAGGTGVSPKCPAAGAGTVSHRGWCVRSARHWGEWSAWVQPWQGCQRVIAREYHTGLASE